MDRPDEQGLDMQYAYAPKGISKQPTSPSKPRKKAANQGDPFLKDDHDTKVTFKIDNDIMAKQRDSIEESAYYNPASS